MNTWTVKMNAWTGDANATGLLDRSIYMHEIPLHICSIIFYFLDRNHLWEEAALKMGYSPFDVIVSSVFHFSFDKISNFFCNFPLEPERKSSRKKQNLLYF